MSYLKGTDIIGALAIDKDRGTASKPSSAPKSAPKVLPQSTSRPVSLNTPASAPLSAATIAKAVTAMSTPAPPPLSAETIARAVTAMAANPGAMSQISNMPLKFSTSSPLGQVATQALSTASKPTVSRADLNNAHAKAKAAASHLVTAGNANNRSLGSKLVSKGQRVSAAAARRVSKVEADATVQGIFGDILGADISQISTIQFGTQSIMDAIATQAQVADAIASMADAVNVMLDLIEQLKSAGQTSLVASGETIYNRADAVVSAYDPDADPPDTSVMPEVRSVQNAAASWVQQAQSASGSAASSTASTSANAPTITSMLNQTSGYATGGNPGDTILITGTNFTGTTSVDFAGAPAPFVVSSPTQITATVPMAAVTGPVHVTTPNGTATSPSPFTNLATTANAGAAGTAGGGGFGGGGGGGGDFEGGEEAFEDDGGGAPDEENVDWGDSTTSRDDSDFFAEAEPSYAPRPRARRVMRMPSNVQPQTNEEQTPAPVAQPATTEVKKTVQERYSEGTDVLIDILGAAPVAVGEVLGMIDIQANRRQMDDLKTITVGIARALLEGGQRVIDDARRVADKKDLPGKTARDNVYWKLQWHANQLRGMSQIPTVVYEPGNDLKKWVMQAFIEANAVEEGAQWIGTTWGEMWDKITAALAQLPKKAREAVYNAANETSKLLTGVPIWAWYLVGVAGVGLAGYVGYKIVTGPAGAALVRVALR